ncbi:MAG: cell envelope integrity protein TolA [Lysobacteraceae bacterium]
MIDERRESLRYVLWAIGLHAALFALLFVGALFHRTPEPLSVAGGTIEAVLVDMPAPASTARPVRPPAKVEPLVTAPKPQPKPEPKPADSPIPQQTAPQAPVPKPDVVDQERIDETALKKAEEQKKVQEEKHRQEQVLLDERKRLEAERKQRLAQQEAEREKQLADIRRQREVAERERKLAEEKLKQLQDLKKQAATPAPVNNAPPSDRLGNQGTDDGLAGRYLLALQQQIDRNWLRPDNLPEGVKCLVRVTQMVGGQVTGVDFSRCPYDELGQRSVEAALRREPLPYRGYESVFSRELSIPFCYPDDARACQQ